MSALAIGLVRTSISHNVAADEARIHALADEHGYDLRGILTIHPGVYLPTVLTVQTVCEHGAAALIVPALAHLGGTERTVALACDVVTPREVYPRAIAQR